jgi:hypothetical protein
MPPAPMMLTSPPLGEKKLKIKQLFSPLGGKYKGVKYIRIMSPSGVEEQIIT